MVPKVVPPLGNCCFCCTTSPLFLLLLLEETFLLLLLELLAWLPLLELFLLVGASSLEDDELCIAGGSGPLLEPDKEVRLLSSRFVICSLLDILELPVMLAVSSDGLRSLMVTFEIGFMIGGLMTVLFLESCDGVRLLGSGVRLLLLRL